MKNENEKTEAEKRNELPPLPAGEHVEVHGDDFEGTKLAEIVAVHKFGPIFGYTAKVDRKTVHINKDLRGEWTIISRVYRGS